MGCGLSLSTICSFLSFTLSSLNIASLYVFFIDLHFVRMAKEIEKRLIKEKKIKKEIK